MQLYRDKKDTVEINPRADETILRIRFYPNYSAASVRRFLSTPLRASAGLRNAPL
jgi:hypothetical protein